MIPFLIFQAKYPNMLHSFFIQMAPPVLLFYTTSITFFTTNLLLHFFFRSSSSAKRERASQAPAVSSCCNCLRLQEPLHPLEILHKLQRSSCFFQPLKSSRPLEKSRLLKLTTARRRRLACLSTSAWPRLAWPSSPGGVESCQL
jgi:hypothetical protein